MMIGRGGKRLKLAYQKAFEESFVDNYDGWNDVLTIMNTSIQAINDELGEKYETYCYDDFCRLAKTVIDVRIQNVDWDGMMQEEESRRKKEPKKASYIMNSKQRAKKHFQLLEQEILHTCFECAIRNSIGERAYKKFKKEIEQCNKEVVL